MIIHGHFPSSFVKFPFITIHSTGSIAQLVMCLTADPGVASFILALSHTFVQSDHGIISTTILLPSTDSRRVVVSKKQKYVREVLDNCSGKSVDS